MEKKIVAFENKSHRRLLGITYRQKITNVIVKEKIVSLVGNYVPLLAIVNKRKLCWFGHITRHNSLAKTILQSKVDGKRSQGRTRLNWMNNICKCKSKNLEDLLQMMLNRDDWISFCYHRSVMFPLRFSSHGTKKKKKRRYNYYFNSNIIYICLI